MFCASLIYITHCDVLLRDLLLDGLVLTGKAVIFIRCLYDRKDLACILLAVDSGELDGLLGGELIHKC